MKTAYHAMRERHLAMAERHIVGAEQYVTRQHDIVCRLQAAGQGGSETARIARELLQSMEADLKRQVADRKRLLVELRK